MYINVTLDTSRVESVDSSLLTKLNNITPDNLSNVTGSVTLTTPVYSNVLAAVRNKFPNLLINPAAGEYLEFEDSVFEQELITKLSPGDSGLTSSVLNGYNILVTDNSLSAYELYMSNNSGLNDITTGLTTQINGYTAIQLFKNLTSPNVDLTNFANIKAVAWDMFKQNTNLQKINTGRAITIGTRIMAGGYQESAFFQTSNLNSVDAPNVQYLNQYGVYYANSVQEIFLPALREIRGEAIRVGKSGGVEPIVYIGEDFENFISFNNNTSEPFKFMDVAHAHVIILADHKVGCINYTSGTTLSCTNLALGSDDFCWSSKTNLYVLNNTVQNAYLADSLWSSAGVNILTIADIPSDIRNRVTAAGYTLPS